MTVFEHIEISLTQQCMFFVCSVLLGAVIGVIYDAFRILRIAVRHNGAAVFFEDILFCAVTTCMLILMIFCANYGIVRWFSVFGCAGGFLVYRETVGRLVIGAAQLIISFIKKYIVSPVFAVVHYVLCLLARGLTYLGAKIKALKYALRIQLFCRILLIRAKKGFGL